MYGSLPDVSEYFQIFDDYMDFKIYPWSKHGYDQGRLFPERKNAIRMLLLAINLHQNHELPENLFDLLEEYNPDKYKTPDDDPKKAKRIKKIKDKKQVGHDSTNKAISSKVKENFDMQSRRGFAPHDMVVRQETINHGINPKTGNPRFTDISTRSVFFDAPDEDSINPANWDWKRYASAEDIKRQAEIDKQQKQKEQQGQPPKKGKKGRERITQQKKTKT